MLDKQLEELKLTGSLPSPTGVGLSILKLTQGDDYSMGDVTRVIQSDPALTGRILRLANSAAHGASTPTTTVRDAAMRLGVRSVRSVALGFTLVSGNRSGNCRGFDYSAYWSRSLATAVSAQSLASELRLCLPADAFTCGLLSGIGTLALASIHPEHYSVMLAKARQSGLQELVPLERDTFDLDHNYLAAALLRDWKLPESFAHAVSTYEYDERADDDVPKDSRSMARCVRLGSALARTLLAGADLESSETEDLRAELQIDEERFEGFWSELLEQWDDWGRLLRIPTDRRVGRAPGIESIAAEQASAVEEDMSVGPHAESNTPQERKGLRVLAVDDDPVSLRLLEHLLTTDGHHVIKATNGRQALIAALEGNPQMVITDWMMPEMDGVELCKALRRTAEGRGVYLLLVTGREDEDRVVEAFDAGADEYVVKPFNPKILLARVRAGQRMIELREQNERNHEEQKRHVADMAVLNRKYQAAAMTDVLTKLPNRRYGMRRLEQELAASKPGTRPLSVIMLDIDKFKSVNDEHGHDMGDLVLRETAEVLRRLVRRGDVVCRLGGEEFLLICVNADIANGTATAERVRAEVEANQIGFGFDRNVTVSLGVACLDELTSRTVDDLIKLADRRVYEAKAAGRNRVVAAPPTPPTRSTA